MAVRLTNGLIHRQRAPTNQLAYQARSIDASARSRRMEAAQIIAFARMATTLTLGVPAAQDAHSTVEVAAAFYHSRASRRA